MAYDPFRKLKRWERQDELELAMAEALNGVIRGEVTSDEARERFFALLKDRMRKRRALKWRMKFQRSLLHAVLGGVPEPGPDDLHAVMVYLRRRVEKGSLSLADVKERMERATAALPDEERARWAAALEAFLLQGPSGAPDPLPGATPPDALP
ncbi:MAG TPA: hypothetical protein VGA70_11745 [Longimicrobiales bacterium]|jgi:hypothetical protein